MEFASNHVYLGRSEEEVDESLLDIVEASGGLSNIVQAPSQSLHRAGLDEAADDDRPPAAQKKEKDGKKKQKPGFFARLFGRSRGSASSSSSSAVASSAPAPQSQRQYTDSESDGEASDQDGDASEARRERAPPKQAPPVELLNFLNSAPAPAPAVEAAAPAADAAAAVAVGLGGVPGAVCGEPLRPPARDAPAQCMPPPPPAPPRKVHKRAVDTNVLAVKFATLSKPADEVVNTPLIKCDRCTAALNQLSTLFDAAGSKIVPGAANSGSSAAPASAPGGAPILVQVEAPSSLPAHIQLEEGQLFWPCEFCAHENILGGVQPEDLPSATSRDYIIEPAPAAAVSTLDAGDGLLLFVLDISGSMCVSAPVPGKLKLRGAREIDPSLLALGDVDMSGVGGNVTYVSRLQAVQASIAKQLAQLAKDAPHKRVGLITFNGEVTLIGDAATKPVVLSADKLTSHEALTKIGSEYAGVTRPISETREQLEDALFKLEETGPTALGPALVAAIAIAGKARGSSILVCTDGLANVGLGSMSDPNVSPRELEAWYTAQGCLARDAGTTVSVISIKGDECKLEALGLVAAETGGGVERVDPANMEHEFGAMLRNPVVATNVRCTFVLHRGMQFRNEDAEQARADAQARCKQAEAAKKVAAPAEPAEGLASLPDEAAKPAAPASDAAAALGDLSNRLVREVGNVWSDSEASLDYGLRSDAELAAYAHLRALPFQVQLEYTTLAGQRATRVLTAAQPVTLDRAVAEREVRVELLSAQVAQRSAALAKAGRYKDARLHWLGASPMLARVAQSDAQRQTFSNYANQIDQFDRVMASQQRLEERAQEQEDGVGGEGAYGIPSAPAGSSAPMGGMRKSAMKKSAMSDETYRVLHKTTQLRSAGLL